MNCKILFQAFLFACALFITPFHLRAALPSEGVWSATTITANETVNLTGDVTITGLIRVSTGTLTINNTSGKTVTISSGIGEQCFLIHTTAASINIIGNSESERIIFDGGADYTWNDDTYTLTTSKTNPEDKDNSFIVSLSEMNARFVTFRNIFGRHVVNITSNKKSNFRNCVFEKCWGRYVGTALYIGQSTANPEDCAITIEDCVFQNCIAAGYDHEDTKYSGIVRAIGSSSNNISAKNITMRKNRLVGGGCFCFLSAGHKDVKLVLDGCSFLDNKVGSNGGALWIEGKLEFTGNTTTVKGNYAEWNGGGLYIPTYGGDLIHERTDRVYNIDSKLIITDNFCKGYGGGISFNFKNDRLPEGSTVTTNIDGAVIENNHAEMGGAGIFFKNATPASKNYAFSIKLNSGTISGNYCKQGASVVGEGGGIYVESIDVTNSGTGKSTEICNISNNSALNGGGIYIKNGKLELKETDINKNIATANGGGAFIEGGSFSISAGKISENKCDQYGDGVYSSYSGADYIASSLSGGTISNNTAIAGGGICVDGKINFTTSGSDIEKNNATNGGGICVLNGAKMTYKSGLIRNNTATSGTTITGGTAYLKDETEVEGFGGGVFVADNGSSLTLDISDGKLGLYDNNATNGGDDIFANGNGTSVTVPDISTMTLTDFAVPLPALFWAEDYSTNDTNYGEGTKMNTSWSNTNLRYRDALSTNAVIYKVPAGTYTGKYISLALGYDNIAITVRKTGLKKGDSAIFDISKQGDTKPYITIMLTGIDNNGSAVEKSVLIYAGTWTVKENSSWSWAYDPVNAEITQSFIKQSDPTTLFTFENTPKSEVPKHSEAVKVNTIEAK